MMENRDPRRITSHSGLPLPLVCLAVATISALTVHALVFAACPFQTPHKEACIQMGTLCSGARGPNACEATTDMDIWNAWVGCQASANRVQCLPGLAEEQVTCYVECDCDWDAEVELCKKDHQDCIRHFAIEKYAKACPPET